MSCLTYLKAQHNNIGGSCPAARMGQVWCSRKGRQLLLIILLLSCKLWREFPLPLSCRNAAVVPPSSFLLSLASPALRMHILHILISRL